MTSQPYLSLVKFKQWADRGLYEVVNRSIDQLGPEDSIYLLRILDHVSVVDRIFQKHLQGRPNTFKGPRTDILPDIQTLTETALEVDEWYASYALGLSGFDVVQLVECRFTSGETRRMTRGEIILHVCQHGAYHRGNAGIILQKNGVIPNDDRLTDFLELAA